MTKRALVVLLCILISHSLSAQENNIYNKMSLDELLNVDVIETATKKPEDLFETPVSVTIIGKQEIIRSGATCIPEILRLAPGMIVREESPGNFDVHIRGFDDVARNPLIPLPANTITLVMVNYRVCYSYFYGGTFWETLPISIHDIERIEIVRGPSAALYGPNATAGVINIITSQPVEYGSSVKFNSFIGNGNTHSFNALYAYNQNDKTKFTISGNFLNKDRTDQQYFSYKNRQYQSLDSMQLTVNMPRTDNLSKYYTLNDLLNKFGTSYNTQLASRQLGVNASLVHSLGENQTIEFFSGVQTSMNQKAYNLNLATPFCMYASNSWYAQLNSRFNRFYSQISYTSGENLNSFSTFNSKYGITDLNVEYDYELNKVNIRPGINFRNASYDNRSIYDSSILLTDIPKLEGKYRNITATALSLLTDWHPTPKLRVIGAFRIDKFNLNDQPSVNYEISTTYRLNKNNLLRFGFSKADRSPFLIDRFVNVSQVFNWEYDLSGLGYNKAPFNGSVTTQYGSSKDFKDLTNHTIELGLRSKIGSHWSTNIEFFCSRMDNLMASVIDPRVFYINAAVDKQLIRFIRLLRLPLSLIGQNISFKMDSINSINASAVVTSQPLTDFWAIQYGSSVDIGYKNDKFNLKLFGTLQHTYFDGSGGYVYETKDSSVVAFNPQTGIVTLKIENKLSPVTWSTKSTPTFYGGFYVDYQAIKQLTLNLNGYFSTKQVFTGFRTDVYAKPFLNSTDYFDNVDSYLVLNAKVSFQLINTGKIYFSVRNLLGKHKEYGFTDNLERLFLVGLQYGF